MNQHHRPPRGRCHGFGDGAPDELLHARPRVREQHDGSGVERVGVLGNRGRHRVGTHALFDEVDDDGSSGQTTQFGRPKKMVPDKRFSGSSQFVFRRFRRRRRVVQRARRRGGGGSFGDDVQQVQRVAVAEQVGRGPGDGAGGVLC